MKKLFTSCIIVLSALCSWGYSSMAFYGIDGSYQYVAVEGLEISIDNDELVATNNTQTLRLAVGKLARMEFSEHTTLIDDVVAPGAVEVFTLDGLSLGTKASVAAAIAELEAGIYVVRDANGKTIKILKGNE